MINIDHEDRPGDSLNFGFYCGRFAVTVYNGDADANRYEADGATHREKLIKLHEALGQFLDETKDNEPSFDVISAPYYYTDEDTGEIDES
jgi:hypothetical protein